MEKSCDMGSNMVVKAVFKPTTLSSSLTSIAGAYLLNRVNSL